MNFAEMITEVTTITGRPDKVDLIKSALKKATLKAHCADEWRQDFAIVTKALPAGSNGRISISLADAEFVRPRIVSYIREYAVPRPAYPVEFTPVEGDGILDSYGAEKRNWFMRTGSSLLLAVPVSLSTITTVEIGYWQFPDVSETTYTSWIAGSYYPIITEEAASAVFKAIGKDQEYQRFQVLFAENLSMLRQISIESQGR